MKVFDLKFVQEMHGENPWWTNKPLPEVPIFKRSDYQHYVDECNAARIHVLLGPRRCGKSKLILQVINHLLNEKHIDPRRILLASLDRVFFELREQKLQDAITYYEENILGKSIRDSKEIIYLFIDEAHFDPLWSRVFKQYADQGAPVYAIISGSSAASLYRDQESAAGRFHINQMSTWKFRDVVRWNNIAEEKTITERSQGMRAAFLESVKTKNVQVYWQSLNQINSLPSTDIDLIKRSLDEYLLKGGYPEFYSTKRTWKEISSHYQTDVFDIILMKDVVAVSNIRQPEKVRTLLVLIAKNTSSLLTREKIKERLNLATTKTVDDYIDALAEAFLIRTAIKFKPGAGYPSTRARKYYVGDAGMRNAVLNYDETSINTMERGALLETTIFLHGLRLMFHADRELRVKGYYWFDDFERDIILDFTRNYGVVVPIEVKNGHCGQEDIAKMKITLNKTKAPFGMIICNDQIGVVEGNILLLPPWMFLLSC